MTLVGGATGVELEVVRGLMSVAEPATVAGPVVLWPLLLLFIGGLLVSAVWSLLRGRRGN
ncbi:hypothetical protein [Haladaptatus caseinilyticus]|uniref:hypothetical protein n=1 Tax=Haladaptatus caseinilyticus TaxID=2993314 RepID=UPI00224AD009|nr:hypothetical protein [Haladaptatus caseinilyticus]